MKLRKNKFVYKILGILFVLLLGACSEEGTSEGSDGSRKVVVGGLYDITGGTGDVGTPYAEGEKAYFKYAKDKGETSRCRF